MIGKLTGDGGAEAEDVPKKALQFSPINSDFWALTLETKVVQHVESEWMRDWKSVSARKSESFAGSQLCRSDIFSWEPALETVMSVDWLMIMMMRSKKTIAIFGYK